MKKTLLLVVMAVLFGNGIQLHAQSPDGGKKILIVYYSLLNGNTRIVAEHIQKNIGGDKELLVQGSAVKESMPDVIQWLKYIKMIS